ncbi:cysteine-rich CWC family protein [Marinobacter sp. SS21]|uniref:cysteine-rich CWC family protein n=1 Tax=Marinobacter sp. SS21 TaxID=2979460 RepID=UPI003FA5CBC6
MFSGRVDQTHGRRRDRHGLRYAVGVDYGRKQFEPMTNPSPGLTLPLNRDAVHCPICGQENQCAVTAGKNPASCWCFAPDITVGDAVTAAVPTAKKRTACVCADCISRLTAGQ